ncbi:expressed unknown protein [Seminavis robusta]|uniref:Uncharacterized protein n=1 Tax=Seminavis robusta TaxID=568900 RepID=A0A9N8D869_9STRA|nr:expressed unknown protein [Seminavis robusta]|eukprot:Sro12_g009590.1 n/a (171) ;mRNA; r:183827-184339
MEGLRHSLLAPSGATVVIIFGTLDAMMTMIKTKYSAKDDNGKMLFPHPFAPWTKVDPKYEDQADKALRAWRMFENVKEWTFMSLPLMWIFAGFAGSIPKVTDQMVDIAVVTSTIGYCYGNYLFSKGYIESPEKRLKGFNVRTNVVKFWLGGSAIAVVCTALQKYGVLTIS